MHRVLLAGLIAFAAGGSQIGRAHAGNDCEAKTWACSGAEMAGLIDIGNEAVPASIPAQTWSARELGAAMPANLASRPKR